MEQRFSFHFQGKRRGSVQVLAMPLPVSRQALYLYFAVAAAVGRIRSRLLQLVLGQLCGGCAGPW